MRADSSSMTSGIRPYEGHERGALSILYVYRKFATGGLEIDVSSLANGMVRLGHRVGLLTLSEGTARAALGTNVDLQTLHSSRRRLSLVSADRRIKSVIRQGEWKTVHVFSCLPSHLHFSGIFHARRAGARVVWTPMMHPGRAALWEDYPLHIRLPMRVFDAWAPQMARSVDIVAAATEAEARYFARIVEPSKIKLLPPAVEDVATVSPEEANRLRNEYGIGDDPMVLVVCARDEKRKGLGFGVAAFLRMQQRVPRSKLVVVGLEGPPRWGHRKGILLLGRVPTQTLRATLRAADVTFVPSRYEAFSRVVLEAWQQGCPVLCTDGVGLSDQVRKQGGKVVAFGDEVAAATALITIATDEHRAHRPEQAFLDRRYLLENVLRAAEEAYV